MDTSLWFIGSFVLGHLQHKAQANLFLHIVTIHRFCQIPVEATGKEPLLFACHGVTRKRNDDDVLPGLSHIMCSST